MTELYLAFITLVLLLLTANLLNNLRLFRRPERNGGIGELPLVSILVPARNEEDRIEACLESLVEQDYPRFEILVLDDNSEDRTQQIVTDFARAHPNLRLLRGEPLPSDWTGKNYACHQLSRRARGDWLLFTDADTVHRPDCVSRSLETAVREDAKLLSLMPRNRNGSVGEELFMPLVNFAFLCFLPLWLVNRMRERRIAAALGPFMLLERDFYLEIDGHRAVRESITDDLSMARLVKSRGGKVLLMDGTDILDIRFYENLKEIWDGFSKNAFSAFDYSVPTLLGFVLVNFSAFIAPYLFLVGGLLGGRLAPVVLFQVGLISFCRIVLAIRFKSNVLAALLHPVSMVIGLALALNSAVMVLLGRNVLWKERPYEARKGA